MNIRRSRLAYRISAACFFFMQGTVFAAWANRIPDIKGYLNLNDADLGSILFAIPLGQISIMWLSGMLSSKFGSKNMVRVGFIFYPLALLGLSYVNSAWQLFFALMCFGMSANINNIAINTQAVDVERIYGRSIMASFHGIWSLSGFCGGIISSFLVASHVSVREHFIGVLCVAWTVLFFVSPFLVESDSASSSSEDKKPVSRGFFRPTPLIVTLGFIALGCMSCEGIMFDWSVIYFNDIVSAPIDYTRMGYIAFMLTMASGRFVGDKLVTKFGAMRLLRCSGLVIFCGMMLAVTIPHIITATIGFLMVGAGVSSVIPTCYSLAARSRRLKASMAIAIVSTIGFFGFLMGPPVIGYIAYLSNLRFSFALMAFMGLVVSLLAGSKHLRAAATGVYEDTEEVSKELAEAKKSDL